MSENEIKINLRPDQWAKMKKLMDYHFENHKELQPLMAIQEMAELIQEISKAKVHDNFYSIEKILEEIFDAYIMLLQMYQIYVKETGLENRFKQIADKKIKREIWRWKLNE